MFKERLTERRKIQTGNEQFDRCQVKHLAVTMDVVVRRTPLHQHSSEDPHERLDDHKVYAASVSCPQTETNGPIKSGEDTVDTSDKARQMVRAVAARTACHGCIFGGMDPLAVADYRLQLAETNQRLQAVEDTYRASGNS